MAREKPSCRSCQFGVYLDEGYSNYTVENTVFVCSKGKHPDGVFDRFYGEDKRLDFVCTSRRKGVPLSIDVSREAVDHLSKAEKRIYEKALALR